VQGGCIVDAVAEVTDYVARALECAHDPLFLLRVDFHE